MRRRWLNFILSLTNRIYSRKQAIIRQEGIKIILSIVVLFFLEIFLGIVSFPLYLGLKSANVTAFLEEKGSYEKIAYDYNLRRILTLTSAGIVFLIWVIKLSVILFTPNVYGPLQLYKISDLEPADLLGEELVVAETQIQTAPINEGMPAPKFTKAEKIQGGDYIFYGTGQPFSLVVLFLSGEQTAVYTEKVDGEGNWEIGHSQNNFRLNEGNHEVVAFSYNEELNTRSKVSAQQYFKVKTSLLDKLIKNIDIFINFTIIIIIALGVLLIVLTI